MVSFLIYATKAEKKEAGSGFWNSTMPDFSEVLNTTKAAEKQAKEVKKQAKADKKAAREATPAATQAKIMAEIDAQNTKKGKNYVNRENTRSLFLLPAKRMWQTDYLF
jgi:hypothetical protein